MFISLQCLVSCMGGLLLYRVCDIFSHSYYHNRGGLPDLTLWNSVEKRCKVSIVDFDFLIFKHLVLISSNNLYQH